MSAEDERVRAALVVIAQKAKEASNREGRPYTRQLKSLLRWLEENHCPRCRGLGLVPGEITPEMKARGVVHRTVSCPACKPEVAGGGE
jgi:hypothetical protein